MFKAFIRLLEEMVERIERKVKKMYDVRECDVVIICIIKEMEEAFEKTIQESFKADGKEFKKKTGGPISVPKDLSW